jgi:hypothetical protein
MCASPPERATALGAGDIDAIAERVVQLLDRPPRRLLKADEVARLLAVDVAFVYSHQRELGALRPPSKGRRPALRFDRDVVLGALRGPAAAPVEARPVRRVRPRRAPVQRDIELLPYEPRSAA